MVGEEEEGGRDSEKEREERREGEEERARRRPVSSPIPFPLGALAGLNPCAEQCRLDGRARLCVRGRPLGHAPAHEALRSTCACQPRRLTSFPLSVPSSHLSTEPRRPNGCRTLVCAWPFAPSCFRPRRPSAAPGPLRPAWLRSTRAPLPVALSRRRRKPRRHTACHARAQCRVARQDGGRNAGACRHGAEGCACCGVAGNGHGIATCLADPVCQGPAAAADDEACEDKGAGCARCGHAEGREGRGRRLPSGGASNRNAKCWACSLLARGALGVLWPSERTKACLAMKWAGPGQFMCHFAS